MKIKNLFDTRPNQIISGVVIGIVLMFIYKLVRHFLG